MNDTHCFGFGFFLRVPSRWGSRRSREWIHILASCHPQWTRAICVFITTNKCRLGRVSPLLKCHVAKVWNCSDLFGTRNHLASRSGKVTSRPRSRWRFPTEQLLGIREIKKGSYRRLDVVDLQSGSLFWWMHYGRKICAHRGQAGLHER